MDREFYFTEDCFVCGVSNEDGLHLKIEKGDDKAILKCIIEPTYQSFRGIAHGGIISLLIDEVLWYAFYFQGIIAVTRKLEITFKKPLQIGEEVVCQGWVTKKLREELFEGQAKIEDRDGKIIAFAKGNFAKREELKDKIVVFFNKA